MYNKSQDDGLLANKANASDVFTNGQVNGLIPDLFYGVMKFYEDNTGTYEDNSENTRTYEDNNRT